jgi:BirA family biotin operon repressor/biotin-[acetyl-CoA-carboxylase] ligase
MMHGSDVGTGDDALDALALQRLLITKTIGRPLHVLAETSSTNDDVKQLAHQGAPEGTVVVAAQQLKGRGRQGRAFASPAGGVYLSVLLRPRVETSQLSQLTLVVAVAAAEALSAVTDLPIALKWPNDVEIHGKKVAGILTEAILRADAPPAVVVGIGLNVNTPLAQFSPDLRQRITSLAHEMGRPVARQPLIAALLARLEYAYEAFQREDMSHMHERWLHYGHIVGRRVRFDGETTGTVLGLAADGALLVHTGASTLQRIISGDVTFL